MPGRQNRQPRLRRLSLRRLDDHMANKGNSRHVKGLASSRYFAVHRKERRYVMKPAAGRHTLDRSIPIALFAEKAGIAGSSAEAAAFARKRVFKVNGREVRDPKYPVGLNDVVAVDGIGQSYAIGINERAQVTVERGEEGHEDRRLCKVVQRYKARGGIVMMRLHDGSIMKSGKEVEVNDSVILVGGAVGKVLKLGKGSRCMVVDGVHVGAEGSIREIKKGTMKTAPSVLVGLDSGEGFETLLKNIMVVG